MVPQATDNWAIHTELVFICRYQLERSREFTNFEESTKIYHDDEPWSQVQHCIRSHYRSLKSTINWLVQFRDGFSNILSLLETEQMYLSFGGESDQEFSPV